MPRKVSISESKEAPDFALVDHAGRLVRLRDFRGKKVVLFFYVRDGTPGCTKEACSFRDGYGRLRARDVVLLGISPDPMNRTGISRTNTTFRILCLLTRRRRSQRA